MCGIMEIFAVLAKFLLFSQKVLQIPKYLVNFCNSTITKNFLILKIIAVVPGVGLCYCFHQLFRRTFRPISCRNEGLDKRGKYFLRAYQKDVEDLRLGQ